MNPEIDYVLTDAGWPRPRVAGLAVPWVAPTNNLGSMNEGRRLATVGGAICNVCGEGYPHGADAYGFTSFTFNGSDTLRDNFPLEPGQPVTDLDGVDKGDYVSFLDGAVMHWRCARLAAATCPHIKDRMDLVCVRVAANEADVRELDSKLMPTYPAGDSVYVPWPTTL